MRLRIIGGELGGRLFSGPVSDATRPTSERVREALSSALASRGAFDEAVVLDLYCGTGALSFEALSRGASRAVLVDHDRKMCKIAAENAHSLGLQHRARVVESDVKRLPRFLEAPFSLVFADPPYAMADSIVDTIAALDRDHALSPGAWVVLEYASRAAPANLETILTSIQRYRYGDTSIAIGVKAS